MTASPPQGHPGTSASVGSARAMAMAVEAEVGLAGTEAVEGAPQVTASWLRPIALAWQTGELEEVAALTM